MIPRTPDSVSVFAAGASTGRVTLSPGDHTLHVRRIGARVTVGDARPTLVFLHDSLGCDSVWRDFPDAMAAMLECPALVYDRRGYGRSSAFAASPRRPDYLEREADTLRLVLDACDIGQAMLFGHSDGGTIALIAAARMPERIAAVITEGAHVFVEEETLAGIRHAQAALRTTDLRQRLQKHHGEKTDAVTSAWIDVWLSPEFRDWNIEHFLAAVRCPTLVLQGADDEFGTVAQVRRIAAGISGPAETHVVPNARHTPHREARDDTLRLCGEFLRRWVLGETTGNS